MKNFIRLSIVLTFLVWIIFFGGFGRVCEIIQRMSSADHHAGNRSAHAQGVVDAMQRQDNIDKNIKSGE